MGSKYGGGGQAPSPSYDTDLRLTFFFSPRNLFISSGLPRVPHQSAARSEAFGSRAFFTGKQFHIGLNVDHILRSAELGHPLPDAGSSSSSVRSASGASGLLFRLQVSLARRLPEVLLATAPLAVNGGADWGGVFPALSRRCPLPSAAV